MLLNFYDFVEPLNADGLQRRKTALGLHVRGHTETAEVPETTDRVACPAVKPEVDPSVFESVDIRVGLIVSPLDTDSYCSDVGRSFLIRVLVEVNLFPLICPLKLSDLHSGRTVSNFVPWCADRCNACARCGDDG